MSPVSGLDVSGGDVSYTEALLACPPEGVTYTTYPDAMAAGTLVERGRKPRHGHHDPLDAALLVARAAELGLRRTGVLFREPVRYLTVDPEAFDLVHAHVFPVRQVGSDVSLVTSSGFPLPVLYRDRMGWSARRVAVADRGERAVAALTGTEVAWLPPRRAARTMVQSEHYRHALVAAGADPERVVVHPLGIEGEAGAPRTGPPTTVGFVSTVFEEKGGPVAVEAVRALQARRPGLRLVVVGAAPRGGVPQEVSGVEWRGTVPRAELLGPVLAGIDILVLPTRCDSGPPYVVLEALQRGIPVVTSDLPWIDEGLTGPGVRRVRPAVGPVADALGELLDPQAYGAASEAAVALWRARYSQEVLADQIGATYREALSWPAPPPPVPRHAGRPRRTGRRPVRSMA